MFLNVLNQDEKEKCLRLFYLVVNIDGNYSEEEFNLLESYKAQLGLAEIQETEESFEELIDYFSTKSESIRKMLCFEIYGLILADEIIAKREQDLLDSINIKFKIEEEKLEEIKHLVNDLQNLYNNIYKALA